MLRWYLNEISGCCRHIGGWLRSKTQSISWHIAPATSPSNCLRRVLIFIVIFIQFRVLLLFAHHLIWSWHKELFQGGPLYEVIWPKGERLVSEFIQCVGVRPSSELEVINPLSCASYCLHGLWMKITLVHVCVLVDEIRHRTVASQVTHLGNNHKTKLWFFHSLIKTFTKLVLLPPPPYRLPPIVHDDPWMECNGNYDEL